MRVLFFALLVGFLGGCTSVSNVVDSGGNKREFVIENSWVRSTLKKEFVGFRRMNRMSPLIVDDLIIEGNSVDGIVAYNRGTGIEIWRLNITNGVEGGAQVVDGKLYFGASDGHFYCVNARNGSVNWTFEVRAETLAAPTVQEGLIYFQSGADVLYALDASTGKQLWVYNRQVTGNLAVRATTRPVVHGETVLAGFSDGFLVAVKKRDGSLLWERKLGKGNRFHDVDSTPVIDGENMYVASFDGTLASLKVDGGTINWEVEQGGYTPVTLGAGRLTDRLYFSNVSGDIVFLDKASGKQLGVINMKGHGIATQPVIYKNFLLYGESEGSFVVADAETGKTISRFEPGTGIISKPSVIEGTQTAYFLSTSANLYAMRLGYQLTRDRLPWTAQLKAF